MEFSSDYFEDEVREGFFITGMMKRCWAAQMEVLSDINRICEKYHIQYFADSGTLIGAVRHGGFVPWDDDMDIGMLREDYEKFLEHADELPENYSVLNWRRTEEWANAYSRVVNTEKITFDEKHLETYHGFPYAAGVDIFVVDYLYRDSDKEEERRQKAELFMQVAGALVTHKEQDDEYWNMVESMENTYEIYIDKEKNIPMQFYAYAEEALREVKLEDADEVAFMAAWIKFRSSNCPKKAYQDTMRVPFETISIPIPVYYDDVLKSRYGEYMSVNKYGGMHDYPYYRAQEHTLEEKYGWKSWNYQWNPDEVILGQQIHEAREAEQAALREKITSLEKMIQSAPEIYGDLQGQIDVLKQSVRMDENAVEEVVFVTLGGDYWKPFQYFWENEIKKENVDVYVMPVPYFDTAFDGAVVGEHYVDSDYPRDVRLVSFNEYNLETRHPKRIYFQVPYDGENPSFTVHPVFYSGELLKYCDELIYVPYLDIKEISFSDDKSFFSMNYYVKMPGVLHADRIYVPSENMKKNYIRALVDFGGEELRFLWEERIVVADYMTEEYSPSSKKKIYYYTDGAPFLIFKEGAVEKLRQNLEFFESNQKNVEVYWEVYSHMDELVGRKEPNVYEDFVRLYQTYGEKDWLHVVRGAEDEINILDQMDAFYGDPGQQAHMATVKKIPVLIRDGKA